jgi:restriction system protein
LIERGNSVEIQSLPEFSKWIRPLLRALNQLGGSARPSEAVELVAANERVSDETLNEILPSGMQRRFTNQVHWARFYLAHQGYIDRSKQGVWTLTQLGRAAQDLTEAEVARIVEVVQRNARKAREKEISSSPGHSAPKENGKPLEVEQSLAPEGEELDYRTRLLGILQALPPFGFERLSQRLLREAGFQQVVVTGKSGDGGIDGHGVLAVNEFVTFRVLFQCKRYAGSVGSGHVRDFRGAMMGRADKGLILTTGTFTVDAQREAVRDGAPPLELVDGEKLLDLFAKFELGLRPVTTYEIVDPFFDEFRRIG